jgi:hypothetical protein
MAETKSCEVCCENFNNTTKKEITCKGCNYSICKTCARTWLTSTSSDPKCMNCNVAWDRNYLVHNLNKSYVNTEYRKHRTKILTDIELAKMPETVQHAETAKYVKSLQSKNSELNKEIKLMKDKIHKMKLQVSRNAYRIAHPNVRNQGSSLDNERRKFIMPCPSETCRGFLSTSYKCGICNLYTCPDCLTIIGENKNEEHKCDENNVKSAEMIKKDTKPCPTCGERIFKIEGCDQMFCTAPRKDGSGFCETAFSWNTGHIETGNIHNPHYYALQNQKQNLTRNPGDVLCGGVPDMREYLCYLTLYFTEGRCNNGYKITLSNQDNVIHHRHLKVLSNIYGLSQFVSEINQYHLTVLRREVRELADARDARVKYLLNEINKEELGEILNRNDINRQKKIELLNVFEILGVSGIEFLKEVNPSAPSAPTVPATIVRDPVGLAMELENRIAEFKKITEYCNNQFKIIGVNYNTSSYYIPLENDNTVATITGDFYKLTKRVWNFQKKRYGIKDIS